VDDAALVREFFADLGGRFGLSCDTAAGAKEALALAAQRPFYDVYFSARKLPDMDGLEFARRIRALTGDEAKRPSIVLISTRAEWNAVEGEAKISGVDKFLAKPLFPSPVIDCINECLGMDITAGQVPPADPEGMDNFRGHHILVVDDVEINREILMALLIPSNMEISTAGNGLEAVELYTKNPGLYDLIFMDVQMPGVDGYEATRRIRTIEKENSLLGGKKIPIVAMTANVFREDIEKCLAAGMDDHVGKPVDLADVMDKLRKYLGRTNTA
jgi:CheY-like chemotaxis protein